MITENINKDYLEAYKKKDEKIVSILRMLKSAFQNAAIAKKGELSEQEAISILKKEIKQRKDLIETYNKADRLEAAENEAEEIKVIEHYLPVQLSEEEIKKIVDETAESEGVSDIKDMGRLIGKIMSQYGDKVDGSTVSKLIREKLKK